MNFAIIPKNTPFPVLRCSIKEEEIVSLKQSLAEASDGSTFVVFTGDPRSFSTRNFLVLQVLGMIYNMKLEAEAFELFYGLLKESHKYDVPYWEEKLKIAWRRYDDCAAKNISHFFKNERSLRGMAKFYVARHPLHLESSMHEKEYYNSFSHLLFVDERRSEFDYLQHAQNPKALMLNRPSDINDIISVCKLLNPKQEKGNTVIIVKLSPLLLDELDECMRKMKQEEIEVTWLLDPLVTIAIEHQVMTWPLYLSLETLRPIINIFRRSRYNLGGFYMETTGDETECHFYDQTTLKHQARLDVEHSLAIMEEIGLIRFNIFPGGGSWMLMFDG